MSDLEIGLTVGISVFFLGFIVKEVFWNKAKRNQERIDNAVVDSVKKSEDKLIEIDLTIQKIEFKVLNLERGEEQLKKQWSESNSLLGKVNETINMFKDSMKVWHNDISTQNAEMKKSMDRSNELIESSNKINQELLGYLKNKS